MSLTIAQMALAPVMELRARELDLAFPGALRWTSGRRSLHEQARAMAVNHMQDPRAYLVRSYIHAAELLKALDEASAADSVDEVTEVLYDVMEARPALIRSPHLWGHAVDLRPMEDATGQPTPIGAQVVAWIRACGDTEDFRTREGALRRWHWACVESKEV